MQLFLRYAEQSDWLPNTFFTCAYDARVLYILSGKGEMRFHDKVFPLTAGCFCYYPPGQPYWPSSSQEEPMQFVTLNFDFGRRFLSNGKAFSPVPEREFDESKKLLTPEAIPDPAFDRYMVCPEMQQLRDDFVEVVKVFHGTDRYRAQKAEALLAYLLYRVLEAPTITQTRALNAAVAYIEAHCREIKSNAQVAQALHYHPYHLNRLFNKYLQCTLHRYIMQAKLKEAAQLLLQTQLPIFEVARQVGFENADHFSKCFSSQYGVSPSRYRRSLHVV